MKNEELEVREVREVKEVRANTWTTLNTKRSTLNAQPSTLNLQPLFNADYADYRRLKC